jgi:hypothetical protein
MENKRKQKMPKQIKSQSSSANNNLEKWREIPYGA